MLRSKTIRTVLRQMIVDAVGNDPYPVSFAVESTGASRFVVFTINEIPSIDGANKLDLEVNTVGPASDIDGAEYVADKITAALNRSIQITDSAGLYIYKNTINRVDGSDPHTVRFRATYDVTIYERTE